MFTSVMKYEWEKFCVKKINTLCFAAVPLIVLLALKFCLETNVKVGIADVAFSSNTNFHLASLQEMLITAFDAIVIVLFSMSFHEEYWNGNLRLAFIRPVNRSTIYWAKFLTLITAIFLLLILHLFTAFIVGNLFLPHMDTTLLYFKEGMHGFNDILVYSLRYYLLSFLSLITFGAAIEAISIICKTITGVIGASFGYLFISALYIIVAGNFLKDYSSESTIFLSWMSGSLLYTQAKGAAYFAAGVSNVFIYVLLVKFVIFKAISYLAFVKRDYAE